MRNALVFLAAITGLWTGVLSAEEPKPFNTDEALTVIRKQTLSSAFVSIPTGDIKVVGPGSAWSLKDRTINSTTYQWLRAAEKAGLVTIVLDQDFQSFKKGESKSFSFNYVDQMAKSGVTDKITVSLTADGEKLAPRAGQGWEWVRVAPKFSDVSLRLISQDKKSDAINNFVLLMASYTNQQTEITKQFNAISSSPMQNERKVAALFKYDPFKNVWKWVAWEDSNMSEDLEMTNIRKALGDAR